MAKEKVIPSVPEGIIESHCHLDYLKQDATHELLQQARRHGIDRVVTISVDPDNLAAVRSLADEHEMVWCTQGIHPHDAEQVDERVIEEINRHCRHPKCVAIGEIGLDYYYEHSQRQVQRKVFEQQLHLACDHDLPVVIHTREADDDTMAILAQFSGRIRGVVHSFTSSLQLAMYCLDQGFSLGFNGIITFNRADNVREVLAATPLERILLETDAPFLTPTPFRGRENAPHYLPVIAHKVAEVKQLSVEQVVEQTRRNTLGLFWPQA